MARTSRKGTPPRNPLLAIQWPAQVERRDAGMFDVFFRSPNRDRLQIPHWRGRVFSIKEGTRLDYASSAGRRLILQLDPLPEVTRLWPFAIEIPIRTPVRGQMAVLFPDLVIALYDGRWAVVVCRTTAGMASAEGKSTWASIQAYAERYGLGCLMTDGTLSTADLTGMPLPEGFASALSDAVREAGRLVRTDVERLMARFGATQQQMLSAVWQEPMTYRPTPGWIDWVGPSSTGPSEASS